MGEVSPCRRRPSLSTVRPVYAPLYAHRPLLARSTSMRCTTGVSGSGVPTASRRPVLVATVMLAAGLMASCSPSASDEAVPTTTTTPATSTTASPISTTSTPTSSSVPEPEWTDEELAIIEAHGQFQAEFLAALIDQSRDLSLLADLTTPSFGSALVDVIESRRVDGITTDGTLETWPLEVRVLSTTTAEIVVCSWDRTTRIEAGRRTTDPDSAPVVHASEMENVNGRWVAGPRIDEPTTGEVCEL